MGKFAIIIPTLNGGVKLKRLLESLNRQTLHPDKIMVIDSGSVDQTVDTAVAFGCEVITIQQTEFDHGATRQSGVERLGNVEIVVFFTQDAIPVDSDSLRLLIHCFANPRVGAAYGRQVPDDKACLIGAHARLLNYPALSTIKTRKDIPKLGLKTPFISNSFAAYRQSALKAVGGFPQKIILGEDMIVAAKMLLANWKIAYCAEAQVFHYHNYSFIREFKRYFDIGVTHAQAPWIRERFGKLEGEGLRYIHSEIKFLMKNNVWLIPSAMLRSVLKFSGYRFGTWERKIPRSIKRHLSMNAQFWHKQQYDHSQPMNLHLKSYHYTDGESLKSCN